MMLKNNQTNTNQTTPKTTLLGTAPTSASFAADVLYLSTVNWNNGPAFDVAVRPAQSQASQRLVMDIAKNRVADYISPMYQQASRRNGDFVTIDPQFSDLPLLWGSDKCPVFVYEVVDLIEETLDLSELHSRLPTLSYAQIAGTLGFLRTLAQFNRKGLDIDAMQDEDMEASPEFQQALRNAVQDKETARVLAPL